jgi:hypothetical protein
VRKLWVSLLILVLLEEGLMIPTFPLSTLTPKKETFLPTIHR